MPRPEAYKSYRAYLNAQLHVASLRISGDDSALRSFLEELGVSSVLDLNDSQAEALLNRMRSKSKEQHASDFARLPAEVGRTSDSPNGMTEQQRRKIIRLTKYVLYWTPGGTFSFIIDNCPLLRDRLTRWEVQNSKLNKLYKAMSFKDADFIIKKLEKIEERDTLSDMYFEAIYQFLTLPKRVNMITAKINWLKTTYQYSSGSPRPSGEGPGVRALLIVTICILSLLFLGLSYAR